MEVNPFHNGHKYFLDQIDINKDDILVAIVSTSIVQRGDITVLNKHDKASLLLDNRVDLVIELPSFYANQGGLYFAKHSINILKEVGITHLYFGSESNNLKKLQELVNLGVDQLDFKNGLYKTELNNLKSNDILALSYLKAIKDLDIKPVMIKRINNDYNDTKITGSITSATSIRLNIFDKNIINTLPKYSYDNIKTINYDQLFVLFINNLYTCIDNNLIIFLSENNQLLFKLKKVYELHNPKTLKELVDLGCDKNNSKHKLNRIIINTCLIAQDLEIEYDYIRILGFSTRGRSLMKHKKIVTSLKNNNSELASYEKRATNLYNLLTNQQIKHDYIKPIVKM